MARPAALAALPDPPDDSHRTRSANPPPTTPHELQAAVEGVPVGDRVEFMGGQYRIADRIGLMPLMRFAHAARKGTNAEDLEGLAAIYDMLRDCLDPEDWSRFERDATDKKAEAEQLLEVVSDTIEILAARPTSRPSDSSDGPLPTSPNSTGSSPSPDTGTGVVTEKAYTVDDLIRRAEKG